MVKNTKRVWRGGGGVENRKVEIFFCVYIIGCYLLISNHVDGLERLVESEERER